MAEILEDTIPVEDLKVTPLLFVSISMGLQFRIFSPFTDFAVSVY